MAGTVLYDEIFETDNYLGNQGKALYQYRSYETGKIHKV